MSAKPRLWDAPPVALKACRHGLFAYNVHDTFVGRSLDRYGEWGEAELALLGLLLEPGQVVVDVGANIGTHTVFFAKHVGPTGQVIALEPQRAVYYTLCANVALNGLANVICLEAGAARTRTTLELPALDPNAPANFGAASALGRRAGPTLRVEALPLDELSLAQCALIKVDVEGMEAEVVAGARDTIARARPALFLECNQPGGNPALLSLIEEIGYRAYWHFAPYYSPRNFFGETENVFEAHGVEANLLCAPADVAIDALPPAIGLDDTFERALARAARDARHG
jgi:FkbM family methyltransferase